MPGWVVPPPPFGGSGAGAAVVGGRAVPYLRCSPTHHGRSGVSATVGEVGRGLSRDGS